MKKIFIEVNEKIQDLVGFKDLGFQQVLFHDYHATLLRTDGIITHKIFYSIFPFDAQSNITHIRYEVYFNKINQILKKFVSDFNPYDYIFCDNESWQKASSISLGFNKHIIEKEVLNESFLIEACKLFKMNYETYGVPFFDKIKTLQDVNDEILEKYDWLEWSNYINGQAYFKALVILKLCNNGTKYAEFSSLYKLRIESAIREGHTEYQDFYNYLIELCNYLESGKYLEIDYTTDIEIVQPKVMEVKKTKRQIPILPINTEVEAVFSECQVAFKELGIYFDKKFTLNDYRNDATWQSWEMEIPDKINWVYFLLLFSGTDVYNHNIDEYQPVSPNVYYFDSEWDGFVSYKEIMERLNLMTGSKLPFANIENKEEGTCTFDYKGESYEWTFELNSDWTDPEIFERFISLVSADIEKTYYIMLEGQGGIIVYYNKHERQRFENYFNVKLVRL